MKIRLPDRFVRCIEMIHPANNTVDGIEVIPNQNKFAIFSYTTGARFSNLRIDVFLSNFREKATALKLDDKATFSVAWKPDGEEILTAGASGEITRWNITDGQILTQYRCGDSSILSVAWSPDGTRFASVSEDNCIYVGEIITGEIVLLANLGKAPDIGEGDAITWIAWNPAGKHLATIGWDAKVRIWETGSNPYKLTLVLEGHSESLYCGAWSADGTKLASGGKEICVWDISNGKLSQMLGEGIGRIYALAWNPDSQFLAVGDSEGVLKVWDTRTSKTIGHLQTTLDDIRAVAWYSDSLFYGGKTSNRWMIPILD